MGYMQVEKHTETQLRLLREPTFLSKAVFVGFFVGILGIFFFGSESFIFKALIGLCATGLSCLIVDNYEICEFDKTANEVRMTRLHWCQYILNKMVSLGSPPYVKARLEDIRDVRVEEQGGPNGGRAYQVILCLDSGIQLGVTEVFTTDDISEHENMARLISSFLGDLPGTLIDEEADDEEDEASSSEDDFEQITKAELVDLEQEDKEETEKGAGGDDVNIEPHVETQPEEQGNAVCSADIQSSS
ncbi:cytochrome b-245 chaperone 1 [Biomphalaria pfeifferi]|uniref:Essential for reactive oxygen species protein n=1 Tax=Biomphalaria pfeifferi TaxID=112525 RepID=A0AAD8B8A3_BIOPF|nr:cytochrome b-245 chaperone 1 [Biomphalaria pfeifferi]